MPEVRVWDPLVRWVHWALAILIVIELTNEAGANPWHRYLGYCVGALVLLRLMWGLGDTQHARLASMAGRASQALPSLRRSGRNVDRSAAHTPLGALMAFGLWTLTLFVVLTGWMLQLDPFWGDETLQGMHRWASYLLMVGAATHVTSAIVVSLVTRSNLVRSMFTGRKSTVK